MTKTFREAFTEMVKRPEWSIRRVAALSGVSEEQLKKVNQGKSLTTNVDDAVRVANAFGLTLDEFLDDTTAIDRMRVVDLYSQLSEAERAILRDAARGRSDQGQKASE